MNAIAEYSSASRKFKASHRSLAVFEDALPGSQAFQVQPDLIMQEHDVHGDDERSLRWRDVLCCLEVKVNATEGPLRQIQLESPTDASAAPSVTQSLAHAADCATNHISYRPFQLFSIGVMIFGSHFVVSIYDRGGVMHSSQMDVFDSGGITDDFIRVVRQLCFGLTEYDLGRDPTASFVGCEGPLEFPVYNIGLSAAFPPKQTCCSAWRVVDDERSSHLDVSFSPRPGHHCVAS